ncbi:MAG: thiolase domain-containing protein [Thermoplasmata archaeon]|nr:thiolase domain-containing protein [Thermoplasmata archaeon]
MTRKVCIIGGATTPFDYGPSGWENPENGAAECVREVQEDVPEFHLRDVDLMVYSHFSVHFAHQLAGEWIVHDHLGLVGLPHFRVENGGNTGGSALYAAALAIMSGHHDVVGIVGWETMDSVSQSQGSEFIAMASDIRYELLVGGIYPIYYAAMANKWMRENRVTEEDVAAIGAKNRNNAMDNPKAQWYRTEHRHITVDDVMGSKLIAYPIKKYDCCLMSRGVAFMVVCTEEYARKVNPDGYVTIDGIGLSSCTIRAGDRPNYPAWAERYGPGYPDMTEFGACRQSADFAYRMAGIDDPLHQIDFGEIHDAFSTSEAQIYKALYLTDTDGVAQFLRDGETELTGSIPMNPGGGLMGYGHPVGATGLMSAVEAYYQLCGMIPKKHLSKRTEVPDAGCGIVNSHAGTGTSISNFILRRCA